MRPLIAIAVAGVCAALAACADPRPPAGDGCAKTGVHGCGVLDPASDEFHGRVLADLAWDLDVCASCHGADFAGTSKAPTCRTCHADGPTACNTCHEATPTTGAHARHRAGGVTCDQCHRVPQSWKDEGHIRVEGAADPAPAEVAMTDRAAITPTGVTRTGAPSFDHASATCSQVYCHGDVLTAAGGANPRPRWSTPSGPTACSSCHGQPPPSHAWTSCATCHPASAPHIDGTVDVATACNGCHGSAASPAPPGDLAGNQFTTAIGVGAHQAHLTAPSRLSAPIPCAACHVVPTTVGAAGHIDTAGPAEVVAALGWDRTTATCGTAWCHKAAQPVWTRTGEAACGTCHGVPPANANHIPSFTLRDCVLCHPNTVDGFGNIKFVAGPSGPTTAHLDGDVDAP